MHFVELRDGTIINIEAITMIDPDPGYESPYLRLIGHDKKIELYSSDCNFIKEEIENLNALSSYKEKN